MHRWPAFSKPAAVRPLHAKQMMDVCIGSFVGGIVKRYEGVRAETEALWRSGNRIELHLAGSFSIRCPHDRHLRMQLPAQFVFVDPQSTFASEAESHSGQSLLVTRNTFLFPSGSVL